MGGAPRIQLSSIAEPTPWTRLDKHLNENVSHGSMGGHHRRCASVDSLL